MTEPKKALEEAGAETFIISPEKIRDVLSGIEASVLRDKETGNLYKLSSKMSREAAVIYRAVGVDRSNTTAKM